ncbi:DUF502 domain-containing protein [Parahaliea sp. F7430]|uniref:DUF502 domain-containing protein n=1 Tax=Sediminihaliea albiluteola TaxID=2758564 RepID=A0A7W2YJ72_9GAMM|nr:DUF502 domain-containing protein [Sediminihaliea albiluteola]MBA6412850.1 DUF502 domain-containing protein [Sediminihaliea albiluteola]
MKRIFSLALQGLAAVLPVALTVYLVYWLLLKMESIAGSVIRLVIADEYYFQGLGVISGFLLLVAIGILVKAYVVRYIIRAGESLLARIPLIKSVFGAIKDFMRVFSLGDNREAESVVLVEIQENAHLLGFITGRKIAGELFPESEQEMLGVYLPMSYQVGGYTLYVESSRLKRLDISVEEAMRIALTGGIQKT